MIMDGLKYSVIISEGEIRKRVAELGREITLAYKGHDLVVIGVLKGSVPFFSDLIDLLTFPWLRILYRSQVIMGVKSHQERL
jgi:hypoxanthine phosphoribosyltransferase